MKDYRQWLREALAQAQRREDVNVYNYQDSGDPRHYAAQIRAEYLTKALGVAMEAESGRDAVADGFAREVAGVLADLRERRKVDEDTAEKLAGLLDWVEGELWRMSL